MSRTPLSVGIHAVVVTAVSGLALLGEARWTSGVPVLVSQGMYGAPSGERAGAEIDGEGLEVWDALAEMLPEGDDGSAAEAVLVPAVFTPVPDARFMHRRHVTRSM